MKSWATQEFSRLSEERVMMAPLYSRPPLSRLFDAEAQLAGLPAPAEAIRQSAETRIGLRFKTMKPVLMRQTFCDFDRYLVGVTADPVVGSQDGDPSSVRARAYNRKRGRFSSSAYCYLIDRATGLAVDLTRAALAAKDSNATLQPMPQAAPVGQTRRPVRFWLEDAIPRQLRTSDESGLPGPSIANAFVEQSAPASN